MKRPAWKHSAKHHGLRPLQLLSLLLALAALLAGLPAAQAAPIASPAPTSDWQLADVTLTPDSPASGDVVVVRFRVLDPQGVPVEHLQTDALLRAPSNARSATTPAPILTTVGRPLPDPGSYEVSVAVNQSGSWWLEVEAHDAVHQTRFSRFLTIDPTRRPTAAPVDLNPLFLQGDAWGAYYRLDPETGSLARLSGEAITRAGGRWWVSTVHLSPLDDPDPLYGGRWQLTVSLDDALSGNAVSRIDLGEIRAGIYVGSNDQPAIATAVAIAPSGTRAYVYWARQLGDGWLANLALVDPASGQVLSRRTLQGAIAADGLWARLEPSEDGSRLLVAEQVVQDADATGFRLTTVDAATLLPRAEQRQVAAPADPLTRCLITYPGPSGLIGGTASQHYSLCTPAPGEAPALVTWDALSGVVTHRVDLAGLAGDSALYLDGVAAPDGKHFYAVNTLSHQIDEIDLMSGSVVRSVNFAPDPRKPAPSTWDRFRDWLLGSVDPGAAAGVLVPHGMTIAPDGQTLYIVAPSTAGGRSYGDGVWIVDSGTLRASGHILTGQPVAGALVAADGQLAIVKHGPGSEDSEISIVQSDGAVMVSLSLPDQVVLAASAH